MSLLCHQLCHNKCHCGSVGYSACLHVLAGLGFNSQTMPFFFTLLYINKGIRLCLNTFITILIKSIWTGSCGMFHDSPYGFHTGYGLKQWLGTQPKNIPYGFHGLGAVHGQSIWNHPGSVKTSFVGVHCCTGHIVAVLVGFSL
jgi:hypothetical protein